MIMFIVINNYSFSIIKYSNFGFSNLVSVTYMQVTLVLFKRILAFFITSYTYM